MLLPHKWDQHLVRILQDGFHIRLGQLASALAANATSEGRLVHRCTMFVVGEGKALQAETVSAGQPHESFWGLFAHGTDLHGLDAFRFHYRL
jgi:hypothetical protein